MKTIKTPSGYDCFQDGDTYTSLITGGVFHNIHALDLMDRREIDLRELIAGRKLKPDEIRQGATADTPIDDRRENPDPANVTRPPGMPSEAERLRIAANYHQNRDKRKSPNDVLLQNMVDRAVELESAADAEAEREAYQNSTSGKAYIHAARQTQNRINCMAGKRISDVRNAETLVAHALAGRTTEFAELNSKLEKQIDARLQDAVAETVAAADSQKLRALEVAKVMGGGE